MPALNRRHFISLIGVGALLAALPILRGKEAVSVTGHLKHIAGNDYLLTAKRHHCDYCYTGAAGSVWKVTSATPLQTGANVTLRGTVKAGRFICA